MCESECVVQEAEEIHFKAMEIMCVCVCVCVVQEAEEMHFKTMDIMCVCVCVCVVQEAEEMHLKAIEIKERLLGPDDYEVALSVGHLASLYNYDMNKYAEAERLYMRSINIGENNNNQAWELSSDLLISDVF